MILKPSLRETIASVISDHPDRRSVVHFVTVCQQFALAYLRHKCRRRTLHPAFLGYNKMEDLALDTIAELFDRDESDHFVQIRNFFCRINWERLDEPLLRSEIRRLVYSKVNERLFRCYHEVDPILSRIIRNLKLTVGHSSKFQLIRRGSELWIEERKQTPRFEGLPLAPPELLEIHFSQLLASGKELTVLIDSFLTFTNSLCYAATYPLSAFAETVRQAYRHLAEPSFDTPTDTGFVSGELIHLIEQTTNEVKNKCHSYLLKNKIDSPTYSIYFQTVADILVAQYVIGTSPGESFYEYLHSHMPYLSPESYRDTHRNILEYLVKRTRGKLLDKLYKDILFNG